MKERKKNFISIEFKYGFDFQTNLLNSFHYKGNLYTFESGETFRNKTFELNLGFGFQ